MHVTGIEIDGFDLSHAGGPASGCIAFVNAKTRLSIAITLPAGAIPHPAILRRRAVDEAIRQVRRLPEYRAGHGCLSFAPSLMAPTLGWPVRA